MSTPAPTTPTEARIRDGQHDFDFIIGKWKVELRRLLRPLTGSTEWVEYDGTSRSRPVWDGRANVDEFRVHSPSTGARIDGLTSAPLQRRDGRVEPVLGQCEQWGSEPASHGRPLHR
jgi:hypothetical protein